MSNNRDLLTEAIADAKAVKETAIANAKLALEEAFTPHLKSMLSAKLEEIDKDDDVKEGAHEEDEMKEGMHEKDKKVDEYGSMKKYEEDDVKKEGMHDSKKDKEVEEEINLDELLAELDEEVSDADKKAIDREVDAVRDDLDQISKLAKDAGEDAEDIKDKIDEAEDKEDVKEDARTDAEEEGYLDGMKDEKEDMEDDMDDDIDLEDMSEDDLKGFIEDVIKDLVSDGTIEAGEDFEEEDMMDDVEVEDSVDVDVEIDEMAHGDKDKDKMEEKAHMDKGERGPGNEDGDKDDTKIEKETEKMRFKEAMQEIEELKNELNEVNLLNAKLLYTNKIFKSKNLAEDKKVKVLKAFDKASTVKEAKVIFETLNEGLVSKAVKNARPQGSASKTTGPITEAKKPIIESNDVYNRMRQLAGLL